MSSALTKSHGEIDDPVALANRVLDRPFADPDDDVAILARQFLRAHERLRSLQGECPSGTTSEPGLQQARKPGESPALLTSKERLSPDIGRTNERLTDKDIVEAFEAISGRYRGDWGAILYIAQGMAKRLREERSIQ